jgi:hypothetical protein
LASRLQPEEAPIASGLLLFAFKNAEHAPCEESDIICELLNRSQNNPLEDLYGDEDPDSPPLELMQAEALEALIIPLLDAALTPHGFELVRRRTWVKSARAPIRHLFSLQVLKGLRVSPLWGLSLDYVPHLAGARLAWHRRPKSARYDLTDDPLDVEDIPLEKLQIDVWHGPAGVRDSAQTCTRNAVPRAMKFFQRAKTIQHVADLFEEIRKRPAIRFGFYNYLQQPLAYAFTLAKLGREAEARRELRHFIKFLNQELSNHPNRKRELARLESLFIDCLNRGK